MADLTASPDRSHGTAAAPKKKPLPFKRHASRLTADQPATESAAKKDENDSDDDLSLFRRSKQLFPKALRERDEEFKVKKEKRKSVDAQKVGTDEKAGRQPASNMAASSLEDDDDAYGVSDRELERRAKKQKVESRDGLLPPGRTGATDHDPPIDPVTPPPSGSSHSVGDSAPASVASQRLAQSLDKGKEPAIPYNLTSPVATKLQPAPHAVASRPIELGSASLSDGDAVVVDQSSPDTKRDADPNQTVTIDDEDESDDLMETEDPEFAKYIIRAQARSEQAKLAREMARAASRPDASPAERISTINDPIITITVKSRLPTPNKITIIQARIKMSQTMKVLRQNFINHARSNGVKIPNDESVFLSWRGIKIYDTTTGLSLHIAPDAEGNIRDEHGHKLNDEARGYHKGGLFFEAWTDHMFEQFQRSRSMAHLRGFDGILDDDDDDEGYDENMGEPGDGGSVQESAPLITITLKSKNSELQPVKLGAAATIAELVAAFRTKRGLRASETVALYFDGLKLDEAANICDTELEDGDEVDVHLS